MALLVLLARPARTRIVAARDGRGSMGGKADDLVDEVVVGEFLGVDTVVDHLSALQESHRLGGVAVIGLAGASKS